MGPEALAQVLRPLKDLIEKQQHPNLIVGLGCGDDAAVYRINEECAVIQTIDFFPPVVDDPYDFGAVAAANSMSDIYAMGGEVALALNVSCFPEDVNPEVLQEILKGGADKVADAGGVLAGGHTVIDKELKYGLSVMGLVHPEKLLTKEGAQPGDTLILTKPLGSGINTTALKNGVVTENQIRSTIDSMKTLNRGASRHLTNGDANACTDVTGFSLIGHAFEIAAASGVALQIDAKKLPFLEMTEECAEEECYPGGTFRNREYYKSMVEFDPSLSERQILTMFTPETSGGLLAAVRSDRIDAVAGRFEAANHPYWLIGSVAEGTGIEVTP